MLVMLELHYKNGEKCTTYHLYHLARGDNFLVFFNNIDEKKPIMLCLFCWYHYGNGMGALLMSYYTGEAYTCVYVAKQIVNK
jgi:hypothetical protein